MAARSVARMRLAEVLFEANGYGLGAAFTGEPQECRDRYLLLAERVMSELGLVAVDRDLVARVRTEANLLGQEPNAWLMVEEAYGTNYATALQELADDVLAQSPRSEVTKP